MSKEIKKILSKHDLSIEQKKILAQKFSFDILNEWDFQKNNELLPTFSIITMPPRTERKVWWLCTKGHSYIASMRHRNEGSQCPICANRKLLVGYNDFATKNPHLVEWWMKSDNNPDPTQVTYVNTTTVIEWYCTNGHFYETIAKEITRGRKCSYCYGNRLLPGFNDIATITPESVEWWDYTKNSKKPQDYKYGSNVKVWWICPLGHSFHARINGFRHGKRCSVCAGKIVDESTRLTTTHPHLIEEWMTEKNSYGPDTISAGHDKKVWWSCSQCYHEWESFVYNRTHKTRPQGCPRCAKGLRSSRGERQIIELLTENGFSSDEIYTHKILEYDEDRKFEIDIYIPSLRLGIEYNGVYYHSELFLEKDYHYRKFKRCEENGIKLLQVWEDDWNLRRDIVSNIILNATQPHHPPKAKVPAKDLKIIEITKNKANDFLSLYHIGEMKHTSHYVGMYLENGELIAVMGLLKKSNCDSGEITHYVSSQLLENGFEKALSYIEETYNFKIIFATSDNCLSTGEIYQNNGFILDSEIEPDYSYLVKKQYRESKSKYKALELQKKKDARWKEKLTEEEIKIANSLLKVYDAGKRRWVKDIEN